MAINKPPDIADKIAELTMMILNKDAGSKPYSWNSFLAISSGDFYFL